MRTRKYDAKYADKIARGVCSLHNAKKKHTHKISAHVKSYHTTANIEIFRHIPTSPYLSHTCPILSYPVPFFMWRGALQISGLKPRAARQFRIHAGASASSIHGLQNLGKNGSERNVTFQCNHMWIICNPPAQWLSIYIVYIYLFIIYLFICLFLQKSFSQHLVLAQFHLPRHEINLMFWFR